MTRYKEIAEDLIGQIRGGRVPVGGVLPGELQLMEDYGASRHTIRDALRQLEELGLVERRRGVGTRVLQRRPSRAYVHRVSSPSELMKYPRESRMQVSATGFVVLLFCHELGHYLAARQRNLPVGLPMFIPFVGAWVALKEEFPDAETEAWVGIAGPLLGGALIRHDPRQVGKRGVRRHAAGQRAFASADSAEVRIQALPRPGQIPQ